MKASTVYRKAAELVDKTPYNAMCIDGIYRFCCNAICNVSGSDATDKTNVHRKAFTKMYGERGDAAYGWYGVPTPETQGARVLALLFAHHIAADEERK